MPFAFDVVSDPYDQNLSYCNLISTEWSQIISYMELVNFSVFPFLLMVCFSSLLIGTIYKARRRVHLNNSEREKKRLRQDIKFSINLILMNFFFFFLTIPNIIALFVYFHNSYLLYVAMYLFDISYGINFYLILSTNSLFRSEFISLFVNKRKTKSPTRQNPPNRRVASRPNS